MPNHRCGHQKRSGPFWKMRRIWHLKTRSNGQGPAASVVAQKNRRTLEGGAGQDAIDAPFLQNLQKQQNTQASSLPPAPPKTVFVSLFFSGILNQKPQKNKMLPQQ